MTTVLAYDAMGAGLETQSGDFIETSDGDLTVTYNDSVAYDSNTDLHYVEYEYGTYYAYFYVDYLGGSTYSITDIFLYDEFDNDLLDIYDLHLQFDANDDFSGDVLFLNMFAGDDSITGNNYSDVLYLGAGQDFGKGRNGNDRIYGESGNDRLYGDGHNDSLYGGSGDDDMYGGSGNDKLYASTGYDLLVGSSGKDLLYGGTDYKYDIFDFNSRSDSAVGSNRDIIYNFTRGSDDIDLRTIDARSSTATNNAFSYSGKTAANFSVWWSSSSTGAIVKADVNGDRIADFEIKISGVLSLSSSDFLL